MLQFDKVKSELAQTESSFTVELKKLKGGKVNVEVIGSIQVEAYGTKVPLNSVAQIQVEDAMNVKISVWDKGSTQAVDKALREANTGASVSIDKDHIRLKFNPMTQEDRALRIKELNQLLEDFKVRVRQVRHKFKKDLDSAKGVSEDEVKRDELELQKLVDSSIKSLEELSSKKEEELTKI